PAPGVYPYEFDYRSGTGGPLALSIPVRPLYSLALTSNNNLTRPAGQQSSFTVQAKDETGAAIPNLALTVTVSGANAQTILATTTTTGAPPTTHPAPTPGPDPAQAPPTINAQAAISNQPTLTWVSAQAPSITVSGDSQLQPPNRGTYTATVTDPVAPA